jgi:hypothetical protein
MNLIEEKNRGSARELPLHSCITHDIPDIFHPCRDSGKLDKLST